MTSRKVARISPMKLSGRPGMLFQTPYDETYVGQLKAMIGRRDRWWNDHRKGWWIAADSARLARHLTLEAFGVAVIVDDEGHETTHDQRTGETLEQGDLLR